METGRLSDHVPGLPAFTVEERRNILAGLIALSREKRGMMLYMFREALIYPDVILNLFNDEVLYLIKTCTPGRGQQLIHRSTDRTCIRQIRSVIRSDLISEYLETPETTVRFLEEILGE